MLSWIFQAYADAFGVATFQRARATEPVDDRRPSRHDAGAASAWRQPSAAASEVDRGAPAVRHAA